MNIPSRFQLFGRTIEVVWDSSVFTEHPETAAFASYRKNCIEMNPNRAISGNDEQVAQTFCHELMHFITYHAGAALREKDHSLMHRDEEFIDLCGNLLHQALSTMEYDSNQGTKG